MLVWHGGNFVGNHITQFLYFNVFTFSRKKSAITSDSLPYYVPVTQWIASDGNGEALNRVI
jgi:hypothetical protein